MKASGRAFAQTLQRIRSSGALGRLGPWLAVLAAYSLSRVYYHFVCDVEFDASSLPWYWQFLDPSLLRADLGRSLWLLHSQPPGFNAFLGIVVKTFDESGSMRTAFAIIYVAFGVMLHGALFSALRTAGVQTWRAVAWTALFIFSPGSILYENWLFYSYPVATMLIMAAAVAGPVARGRPAAAWCLFGLVAIGALSRSSLHLLWVIGIACAVSIGCWQHRRAILFPLVLAIALTAGLYAKNALLFGTFSASTWGGMSLSKLAIENTPRSELDAMIADGRLGSIARIPPFRTLDAYLPADRGDPEALFPPDRHPSIDSILKANGNRNVNHRGYVTVARRYATASLRVMREHPATYLDNWERAWWTYAQPVAEYWDLDPNRHLIAPIHSFYNRFIYGVWGDWTPALEPHFAFETSYLRTRFSVIWMALLLFAMIWIPLRALGDGVHRRAFDARTSILVFAWCTVAFCALAANSVEVGENHRIRFEVEPLIFVLVAACLEDCGSWARRRLVRHPPAA